MLVVTENKQNLGRKTSPHFQNCQGTPQRDLKKLLIKKRVGDIAHVRNETLAILPRLS